MKRHPLSREAASRQCLCFWRHVQQLGLSLVILNNWRGGLAGLKSLYNRAIFIYFAFFFLSFFSFFFLSFFSFLYFFFSSFFSFLFLIFFFTGITRQEWDSNLQESHWQENQTISSSAASVQGKAAAGAAAAMSIPGHRAPSSTRGNTPRHPPRQLCCRTSKFCRRYLRCCICYPNKSFSALP